MSILDEAAHLARALGHRLILPCCSALLATGAAAQVNPLDSLPSHISQLTHFGERAVWSPDGNRIAFVHKTLGDAFELELASDLLRCLTCHFPHPGYFRVHYLPSGDYVLVGPAAVEDREKARWNQAELWLLRASLGEPAIRLDRHLNEGIAVSREHQRIAWSVSSNQSPEIPEGVSRLVVAEVVVDDEGARITGDRVVHEDKWPECWLEAQDFRNDDGELIFSCYQPEDESEVMGVDLRTGTVTNYTMSPEIYDEPEGIFPDGVHTLVECDKQNDRGDHFIDIWKLKLDGTGEDYERLTFFSEHEGFKASNPVVSPDGRRMAFQIARSKDAPGVGYGILLFDFAEAGHRAERE
jgi:Tol biopolymer transport system component